MRYIALLCALLLGANACQSSSDEEVIVMAASSFSGVATQLAAAFEAETGTPARFNLAGSQTLATQIKAGAQADLFLSANELAVEQAGDRITQVDHLVTNELAVLVPTGNPQDIAGLSSLTNPDLVVVIADPSVPAGQYTSQALEQAGLTLQPSSLDPSVARVATRVASGEADAGVGYSTDAVNPLIDTIPLGDGVVIEAEYLAAIIDASSSGTLFIAWIHDETATQILMTAGFTP